jgi:2-dehydro-3-deoxygluconokinase
MKKIVTFGEIMLRLKSPAHERFFQSPLLEATFGGGGVGKRCGVAVNFWKKSFFCYSASR